MSETPEKDKQQNSIVAARMEINGGGLVLRSAEELKLASELFANSGLTASWCDTPAKAAFVIEAGQELGFKPVQALQNFQLINGQLGIKAAAIAGLIKASGKAEYLKDFYEGTEGEDDYKSVILSKRKDDPDEKRTDFSIADAKTAKLWGKDNWQNYPKDMLWSRAMSRHGRRHYGDVLSGFYSVEELSDLPTPEPSHETTTEKRAERKLVGSETKDTNEIMESAITDVFSKFTQKTGMDTSEEFVDFAALALECPADDLWIFAGDMEKTVDPAAFDMDKLKKVAVAIDEYAAPEPPAEEEVEAPEPELPPYVCIRCGNTYKRKPTDMKCKCLGEVKENEPAAT